VRYALFFLSLTLVAGEYHVSPRGNDVGDGSAARPLKTISAAARLAQPGDTITVHAGTYRERVTPPRGGSSDAARITYQAAPGEAAIIKGSEVVNEWKPFQPGVWKATLPNSFFGNYNPYKDLISGDWFTDRGRPHHTGEVYLNGQALFETHLLEGVLHPKSFAEARNPAESLLTWFCESDGQFTYIYANFGARDPNKERVEINVRDACFYPDQPGRDYITVRGFRMSQAATQWAAPTAEQPGLLGTHWSKGWIIENNVISDSKCSGITLGKDRATGHNVWLKDPSRDGAIHYVEVILRALAIGWSRDRIGSHIVRNNVIFNCEQTGICGSLGAVFSSITGNHIYNIWARRQFTGAEMAGIKLHAAIDVLIANNRIHNAGRGIWMDWMAQGTRISSNVLYDNTTQDIFFEVDHGPHMVDNNLLLSAESLYDMSEGGAYVHNLFAGRLVSRTEPARSTPYHLAHSTALAGLCSTQGGDDRFFNNIFLGTDETATKPTATRASGYGTRVYDTRPLQLITGGNLYFKGARPYRYEATPAVSGAAPRPALVEEDGHGYLRLAVGEIPAVATARVTTARLGKARVAQLPYENPDGTPLAIDKDYSGKARDAERPAPGPFETALQGELKLRLW
jgi:hypothetical protein